MLLINSVEIHLKVTSSQTHYFPLKSTKYGVHMPKHQRKDPIPYSAEFPITKFVYNIAPF